MGSSTGNVSVTWKHRPQLACCRDVIVELKVDKGDTLEGLAQMYHLPYEKLLAANKGAAQDVVDCLALMQLSLFQ